MLQDGPNADKRRVLQDCLIAGRGGGMAVLHVLQDGPDMERRENGIARGPQC